MGIYGLEEHAVDKQAIKHVIENVITFFGIHDIGENSKQAQIQYMRGNNGSLEYVVN